MGRRIGHDANGRSECHLRPSRDAVENRGSDNGCRAQKSCLAIYDRQRADVAVHRCHAIAFESLQRPALIHLCGRGVKRLLLPGSNMEGALGHPVAAACPDLAGQKRGRESARHCVLFGVLPLRGWRQVPALVAVFKPTRTTVPLQCDTEMVRPHRHPELP